ncbi:hypothetical protein HPB49_013697 [Dermacentor silvarum]|uniref:Uncharacterized protein n=1 Tax=Dermacentor silvarum TaxID=543639 RepID=A0ACB8D5Q3_DERSI|nr:hypothetical protein HPB49_013697 [Dermacentor silvarum]
MASALRNTDADKAHQLSTEASEDDNMEIRESQGLLPAAEENEEDNEPWINVTSRARRRRLQTRSTTPKLSRTPPKPVLRQSRPAMRKPRQPSLPADDYKQAVGPRNGLQLNKRTMPHCRTCNETGHREDVCPRPPATPKCREYGTSLATEQHECHPRCFLCGGNHPMAAKTYPNRFLPPVNRRKPQQALRAGSSSPRPRGELSASRNCPGEEQFQAALRFRFQAQDLIATPDAIPWQDLEPWRFRKWQEGKQGSSAGHAAAPCSSALPARVAVELRRCLECEDEDSARRADRQDDASSQAAGSDGNLTGRPQRFYPSFPEGEPSPHDLRLDAKSPEDVLPVYLSSCDSGTVRWSYPRGALRIVIQGPPAQREFQACFRVAADSSGALVYAETAQGGLVPGPGVRAKCVLSNRGSAVVYAVASAARAGKRAKLTLTYTTSQPVASFERLEGWEVAEATVRNATLHSDQQSIYWWLSVTETHRGRMPDYVTRPARCGFPRDTQEPRLILARWHLGRPIVTCAPKLLQWKRLMVQDKVQCNYGTNDSSDAVR